MAEHACNYKEWGLQCTFHSKDIGDQCDQISQHVNERFVTRYDMKWDGTVDVYMQSEKLRWKSEVVCVVVVFGVTKKKGKRKTADRWTAEAVVTIILHKRYLLKL